MAEENEDDRSEAPSQKRLDDALGQGDVPKSQEISTWFLIGAIALIINYLSGEGLPGSLTLRGFLLHAGETSNYGNQVFLYKDLAFNTLAEALVGVFALLIAAAILGSSIQHRAVISLDLVRPKLTNISPLSGFKRVFGKETAIQFLKSILKFLIVGSAICAAIWSQHDKLTMLMDQNLPFFINLLRDSIYKLVLTVLVLQAFIAGGDYVYRWFSWYGRLKMTQHDLKEEYKQQEGSPEIRQKLRQLRRDFARRSMMKNVSKATVVITNPTHFAVALQYNTGMQAPVCLAKGVDVLALRIRALAEEHNIPIVEEPPLARSLYRLVEVDEQIPLDLYKPVAEIIGYVMRLRPRQYTRYQNGARAP